MNKTSQFLFATVNRTLFFSLLLVSCSKSDDPGESATDKTKRLLQSTTWQLQTLRVDDVDQTSLYPNLTLTIAAQTYTAQQGDPVWPAAGTWSLTNATTVLRSDNVTITIDELDEDTLTLSFEWEDTTFEEGRKKSISGTHVFEFVKE